MERPATRYALSADGTYIAYQAFGDGPVDIAWQFESYGTIDGCSDGHKTFARA